MLPFDAPPIAGESDREYQARIDAARCTAELRTRSRRQLDCGRRPIEESPLFAGEAQATLFEEAYNSR